MLSAVVVAAEEGSGTFVASLSNNDPDNAATFTALSGDEEASVTAAEFEPVEIGPGGAGQPRRPRRGHRASPASSGRATSYP